MDNGDDGAFANGPYDITLPAALKFDSSAHSIALTAGLTYRFKFLANNAEGDSAFSDEIAVLVAEKPDTVATFIRTSVSTLSAGKIRVEWTAPADNGGSPIRGYKLYIDGVLTYDASEDSSATSYTASGLTVGQNYEFSVSAVNDFAEGDKTDLTLNAASPPSKPDAAFWQASDASSITIEWLKPSFNGGSAVTGYKVRRDNGPLTDWQADVAHSDLVNLGHQFTGLLQATLKYRFQVAAVNAIGTSEWSTPVRLYVAEKPDSPATLTVASQSTEGIKVEWTVPASNGGCDLEGYRLYIEDVSNPGSILVYDGSLVSSVTQKSISAPYIEASKEYVFSIESKNCGYYSDPITLNAFSASVPSTILTPASVLSFDSTTAMTI